MATSKLLRGTFVLTLGTMVSRLIGLIYIFPFYALVGVEGAALYTYAYIPYTIFLSVATMGVPLAVSKFVSKYNALGEYRIGRKLFKSGLLVMMVTGIVSFLILYMIAPLLSPYVIADEGQLHNVHDVTKVIRTVSFALMIVPVMSLIRGFFQGHESMGPTAVSQVVEQIVRIVFILGSAFIIIKVMNGELVTAIGFSTFAAFVGAIGGLGVLIWYWFTRRGHLNELLEEDKGKLTISFKDMYKELLLYAAPFVFVGLAIPMYQLIDEFTFNRAMDSIGLADIAGQAFTMITMLSHKLVIIPVSLATSFALTLIPSVTKSYVAGDSSSLKKQLNQTFQVVFFLTFPAVIGLSLLADPAYATFYSVDELGGNILMWYAPVAILFAFFSVTAAILQGINQQRFTVISLVIGLLMKLSLNVFLISNFASIGAILATAIGFFVSVVFNLYIIKKYTNYHYGFLGKRMLFMVILTTIMALIVKITMWLLSFGISYEEGKLQAIIVLFISVIVGAGVYFLLSYRTNLFYLLFGSRFSFLKKRSL